VLQGVHADLVRGGRGWGAGLGLGVEVMSGRAGAFGGEDIQFDFSAVLNWKLTRTPLPHVEPKAPEQFTEEELNAQAGEAQAEA